MGVAQTLEITEDLDSIITDYGGIDLSNTTEKIVWLRNSYLESAYGSGYMVQVGQDSYSATYYGKRDDSEVYGNKMVWNGTDGGKHNVMAGYNANYNFRYNYVDSMTYGYVHEGGDAEGDPTVNTYAPIMYNVFKDCRMGIMEKGHDGTVISNNTFYNSRSNALFFVFVKSSDTGGNDAVSKNIKIKNNIFYSTTSMTAIRLGSAGDDTEAEIDTVGFECDYNIYYYPNRTNNEPIFYYNESTYTWTEWRALGYDEHSVILDPDFVDTDDLVPTSRLDYGTDLGTDYDYGLATDVEWVVGSFVDTLQQNGDWQVGAHVFASGDPDSDETDILTFTLADQTKEATISTAAHTVDIEVDYGTTVTSLTPTITVSAGATIDPTSGTAQNFTNPVTYTVTAEDGTTEQEWTVTVTVAEQNPSGGNYFVDYTNGSDSNDGSFENPWKTWAKAFNPSSAYSGGDTIYFRGGVYQMEEAEYTANPSWFQYPYTPGRGIKAQNHVGSEGDSIYFIAYPGEIPILDGSNIDVSDEEWGGMNRGMLLYDSRYIVLEGLHMRDFEQSDQYVDVSEAIEVLRVEHARIENCKFYSNGGAGMDMNHSDSVLVKNCDFYSNTDPYGDEGVKPGNDGYGVTTAGADTCHITFKWNRAWLNGDDGFSDGNDGLSTYIGNWSFLNGKLEGAGNGFKMGWIDEDDTELKREYYENIAVFNRANGFNTNEDYYSHLVNKMYVYNNTVISNGGWNDEDYTSSQYGFIIYDTYDTEERKEMREFKNNIAYDNHDGPVFNQGASTQVTNSWNTPPGITLTANDFLTIDSASVIDVLISSRQSDGSLPALGDVLKLSSSSDAIDAGTDVGYGDDLGAFQYEGQDPPVDPVVVTTSNISGIHSTYATAGGDVTDGGGGTVTDRGVAWGTSADPIIDDNKVEDESGGTGAFSVQITGLTPGETYHVRAYASNEEGISYGDDVEFTTIIKSKIVSSSNKVKSNTKKVIKK